MGNRVSNFFCVCCDGAVGATAVFPESGKGAVGGGLLLVARISSSGTSTALATGTSPPRSKLEATT